MFESKTPKAFCQRLAGHFEPNDVLEPFKLHNQTHGYQQQMKHYDKLSQFILHDVHMARFIIRPQSTTHCARSDLDVEHVVLVAQLCYFWPRKSVHVKRIVVDVKSVCADSDVNVDKLGILRSTSEP